MRPSMSQADEVCCCWKHPDSGDFGELEKMMMQQAVVVEAVVVVVEKRKKRTKVDVVDELEKTMLKTKLVLDSVEVLGK